MWFRQVRYFGVVLTVLVVAVLAGCNQGVGGGGGGDGDDGGTGGGGGEQNANGAAGAGGLIDNGLEAPGPLPEGVENMPPTGQGVFPPENATVAAGEVVFIWTAVDPDGTNVDTTIVVSDQPEVFDDPVHTLTVRTAPDEEEHRTTLDVANTGTFYWGIEISDGVNAVRRPASEVGTAFEVTLSGSGRIGLEDAILLCPRGTQPARERTTFRWSLGEVEPLRTTVYVSRFGQENPFESPLQVLEVTPATETFRALSEAEALSIGNELSWGLRLETAEEVLFTFEGQLGEMFLVDENVLPSGQLLGPENDSRLPDGAFLDLIWEDDAGNCEDVLTLTIALEFLGEATEPQALFDSDIQLTAQADSLETDLFPQLMELDLQAGRWAWGILADDGTDQTVLPDADNPDHGFRTFIRDTSPEFVNAPAAASRVCGSAVAGTDAIGFSYDDGNGPDTVGVVVYYASQQGDLFGDPAETMAYDPSAWGQLPEDAFVFVRSVDSSECPEFAHGPGFYGVELDDGVNEPVRAAVIYEGQVEAAQGACCAIDGSCSEVPAADCTDGSYQGDGTTCAATECIPQGACCEADGGCTDGPQDECAAGLYQGDGTTCATAVCGPWGACCAADGTCTEGTEAGCIAGGGIYQGDATTCADVACIPRGACCANDGSCTDGPEAACTDGQYAGDGTTCATTVCVPRGACCLPDGTCLETAEADCADTYQGDGTTCATADCPQPAPEVGACCLYAGGCVEVVASACDGVYQGADTNCQTVVCFIDCNKNGVEDYQDIASGYSRDCNGNLIPDDCEGNPVVPDAGILGPGLINTNGIYDPDSTENYLDGELCPFGQDPQLPWTVEWTVDSVPPSPLPPTVIIFGSDSLFSSYLIENALPGNYVFRLTAFENGVSGASDTVTLTLTAGGGP